MVTVIHRRYWREGYLWRGSLVFDAPGSGFEIEFAPGYERRRSGTGWSALTKRGLNRRLDRWQPRLETLVEVWEFDVQRVRRAADGARVADARRPLHIWTGHAEGNP